MLNRKVFEKGMFLIETALQKALAPEQAEIYYKVLKDLGNKEFENGIVRLLRERKYSNLPTTADIREFCLGSKEGDLIVRAAEAKQKLKKAITQIGAYESIAFDDPILHLMVQDLGGWIKTCGMSSLDLENYFKFNFEKLYKSYAIRQNPAIPLSFKGIHLKKEIKYIGNQEKAIEWQEKYKAKYGEMEFKSVKQIEEVVL